MRDFMIAALPWIIIGIAVAVIFAFRSRKKDDEPQNCMTEGMCLGVAIGSTGLISLALGISSGMLIGEVIGFIIKK